MIEKLIEFYLNYRNLHLVKYKSLPINIKRLIDYLYRLDLIGMQYVEVVQLTEFLNATAHQSGVCVEAGVKRGGSARLIAEYNQKSKIYLLDTNIDQVYKPMFECFPKVRFIQGKAEETITRIRQPIKFANIDTNYYESTVKSLEHIWKYLNVGGVITLHDYICIKSVRDAVEQHIIRHKNYVMIPLINSQVAIIKVMLDEG